MMEINYLLTLLGPTLAIIAGYFMVNAKMTQMSNDLKSGIERLSNEHLAHDSKLVASVAKFEENVNKSFDRNSDDLKEIHTVLHTHIKDETVDHQRILHEVEKNKCQCCGKCK